MIKIGKIVGTFGIKGELKIYPMTNHEEMFLEFDHLILESKKEFRKYELKHARFHKNTVLVILDDIDSINEAEKLIGSEVYMEEELMPELDDGEEYVFRIIGLKVFLEDDSFIGTVVDVFNNGAHSVYELKDENGKEFMIPVLDDTVVSRDFDEGKMTVRLLPGLLD